MEHIKKEPVVLSVLAGNLLALAVAFGIDLSETQTAAIMALVSTVVVIAFGRSNVTPNASVVAREGRDGVVAGQAASQRTGLPVAVVNTTEGYQGQHRA